MLKRILAVVVAAAAMSVGLSGVHQASAATSFNQVSCDSAARMFQLRAGGTELWYSSIGNPASDRPVFYNWRKIYDFNADRPGLAVAAHEILYGAVKLFVTDRDGGLRVYNFDMENAAISSVNNLRTGPGPYDFSRLASDGHRLYGTKEGKLYAMTSVTTNAEPKAMALVKTVGYPLALWGNAGNDQELMYTDSSGVLRAVDVSTTSSGWTATLQTIRSSGWAQAGIASPGAGVIFRDVPDHLWRHLIDIPTHGTNTTITDHKTIANLNTPNEPITSAPDVCGIDTAPGGDAAVTYDQLVAMFGSKVASRSVVEPALPSLVEEMRKGNITTPARKAAFLATLVNESRLHYGATEGGSTSTYRGRGYIQLTGSYNYRGAGDYLDVDLLGSPSLAASSTWSDQIARWYWTKARPGTNSYADKHDMGMVNKQIAFAGYDNPSSPEVAERCADFKSAYKVLAGSYPTNVDCSYDG